MIDKSTPENGSKPTPELGRELLAAFKYQNATISESELLSRRVAMGTAAQVLNEAIEWLKSEQLIEAADEAGRIRLTPQGRSVWRDSMGHA